MEVHVWEASVDSGKHIWFCKDSGRLRKSIFEEDFQQYFDYSVDAMPDNTARGVFVGIKSGPRM